MHRICCWHVDIDIAMRQVIRHVSRLGICNRVRYFMIVAQHQSNDGHLIIVNGMFGARGRHMRMQSQDSGRSQGQAHT